MIVRKMKTNKGNPSKDQYTITINDNLKAFQSYETLVAIYDYRDNIIYQNNDARMSKTTNEYYTKWRISQIHLTPSTKIVCVSDYDIQQIMQW